MIIIIGHVPFSEFTVSSIELHLTSWALQLVGAGQLGPTVAIVINALVTGSQMSH